MSIQESLINLLSFIEVYKYLIMEDFPTPGGPVIKSPLTGSNPDLSNMSFYPKLNFITSEIVRNLSSIP
jgi:hypothetical protein